MSRNSDRVGTQEFDRARDELFSHIHRCGVLKATAEQQEEWLDDTVAYMAERYPELAREQLGELRAIGMRFCRPVIYNVQAVDETGEETGESAATEAAAA